ncbi:MAG: hypothetical protein AB1576_06410 [Bacillota bacterium]
MERLRKNPLAWALRMDKLSLAALEACLYRHEKAWQPFPCCQLLVKRTPASNSCEGSS